MSAIYQSDKELTFRKKNTFKTERHLPPAPKSIRTIFKVGNLQFS